MSTGRTHRTASLILASGFSLGAIITLKPELIICTAGALTGVFISPDQDVDAGNLSNKMIKEKVGWFGERLWKFFWSGYSGSFKHGQFASHFPIFGTFIRIMYVYFWVIFLPHVLISLLFNPNWKLSIVLEWYVRIFLNTWYFYGLASADLIHYVLDKLTKNME